MKKMTDGRRIVAAIKTNRWHFTLFKRRRQSLVTSRWRQDHAHARTALSCTRTCKQPRFQSHRFFLLRGGTGDETNHRFRHQRQRLTWVAPKRIYMHVHGRFNTAFPFHIASWFSSSVSILRLLVRTSTAKGWNLAESVRRNSWKKFVFCNKMISGPFFCRDKKCYASDLSSWQS